MKAAWAILRAKFPGLIINGCAAHTVNLLVIDICKLDAYNEVFGHARLITSIFNDRNALTKAILKNPTNFI